MTLPKHIDTPASVQELADRLTKIMAEPGALHAQGKANLIAQYGSEKDIPIEAYADEPLGTQGYERAAEVLIEAALMAFELAAKEMGVTGFQASYAAGQIMVRINGWEGPIRIVQAKDYLYPQQQGKVADWFAEPEVRDYLVAEALQILSERGNDPTRLNPRVQEHLTQIATNPDWKPSP